MGGLELPDCVLSEGKKGWGGEDGGGTGLSLSQGKVLKTEMSQHTKKFKGFKR